MKLSNLLKRKFKSPKDRLYEKIVNTVTSFRKEMDSEGSLVILNEASVDDINYLIEKFVKKHLLNETIIDSGTYTIDEFEALCNDKYKSKNLIFYVTETCGYMFNVTNADVDKFDCEELIRKRYSKIL